MTLIESVKKTDSAGIKFQYRCRSDLMPDNYKEALSAYYRLRGSFRITPGCMLSYRLLWLCLLFLLVGHIFPATCFHLGSAYLRRQRESSVV